MRSTEHFLFTHHLLCTNQKYELLTWKKDPTQFFVPLFLLHLMVQIINYIQNRCMLNSNKDVRIIETVLINMSVVNSSQHIGKLTFFFSYINLFIIKVLVWKKMLTRRNADLIIYDFEIISCLSCVERCVREEKWLNIEQVPQEYNNYSLEDEQYLINVIVSWSLRSWRQFFLPAKTEKHTKVTYLSILRIPFYFVS
jgi:hypothetical protein